MINDDEYTSNLPIINATNDGIYIREDDCSDYISNERLIDFVEKYYDDFKYEYDYLDKILNKKSY
jgi:hypothetical protein